MQITIVIESDPERLVPLDTWICEHVRSRSIWQRGSPSLTSPTDMGKWLKRHETMLTERGAVVRLGNAWRIVEPTFKPVMFEILDEERDKAHAAKNKGATK
jgi:hypothetical protein